MKQVKILFALVILIAFSTVESALKIDPKKGPQGSCVGGSNCNTRNINGKLYYTQTIDGQKVQSRDREIKSGPIPSYSSDREYTIKGDGFEKWVEKVGSYRLGFLRATYEDFGKTCTKADFGKCAKGACWAVCDDCYGMCITKNLSETETCEADDWDKKCSSEKTCISECVRTHYAPPKPTTSRPDYSKKRLNYGKPSYRL